MLSFNPILSQSRAMHKCPTKFDFLICNTVFILILSVKNRVGEGLLNRKNPLSMTNVICRRVFLKFYTINGVNSAWNLY